MSRSLDTEFNKLGLGQGIRDLQKFFKVLQNVNGNSTSAASFGTGGQVSKMLSSALPELGGFSAALGAAAGPIGVAVTAVELLGKAAKDTAEIFTRNAQAYYTAGGTPSEMAQAQAISGSAGLDVKEFAKAAVDYGREISTNSLAQADANRIGIRDTQNPYASNPDKLTNFEKALQHITSKSISDDEARREAMRNPSLQPFLGLRDQSDTARRRTFASGHDDAAQFGPQARKDAQAYRDNISLINQEWERFVVQVGKPVLGVLIDLGNEVQPVVEGIRDFINALAPYKPLIGGLLPVMALLKEQIGFWKLELDAATYGLMVFGPLFSDLAKTLGDLSGGNFSEALDDVKQFPTDLKKGFDDANKFWSERDKNRQEKEQKQETALDRHTSAMDAHAEALNRAGMYGGGERAHGAVPSMAIGGGQEKRYMLGLSHALGAFSL